MSNFVLSLFLSAAIMDYVWEIGAFLNYIRHAYTSTGYNRYLAIVHVCMSFHHCKSSLHCREPLVNCCGDRPRVHVVSLLQEEAFITHCKRELLRMGAGSSSDQAEAEAVS